MNPLDLLARKPNTLVHYSRFSYSYSKCDYKVLASGEDNLVAKKIYDLEITNKLNSDMKSIRLDGDYFIIDLTYGVSYFHMLFDIFSELDVFESLVPDLKILIMYSSLIPGVEETVSALKTRGFWGPYNLEEATIVDTSDFSVVSVDRVNFINSGYNSFVKPFGSLGNDYSMKTNGPDFIKIFQPLMKSRFVSDTNNESKKQKKIFISRKRDNDGLRIVKDIFQKLERGEEISPSESLHLARKRQAELLEISNRALSESDELLIESLFANAGYEILTPESLGGIGQQAILYNSATHIAGLSGSGFINTVFCDPGTEVIIINTCENYRFPHKQMSESFGNNVFSIPEVDIDGTGSEAFTMEHIIEELRQLGIG